MIKNSISMWEPRIVFLNNAILKWHSFLAFCANQLTHHFELFTKTTIYQGGKLLLTKRQMPTKAGKVHAFRHKNQYSTAQSTKKLRICSSSEFKYPNLWCSRRIVIFRERKIFKQFLHHLSFGASNWGQVGDLSLSKRGAKQRQCCPESHGGRFTNVSTRSWNTV